MTTVRYKIDDLGELSGRILLFGGPYSNLHAAQAMFGWADKNNVPKNARVCTGDVAGYCADPLRTWKATLTQTRVVVAGNVERQIAEDRTDCACGFDATSKCAELSNEWYPYARRSFGKAEKLAMSLLPDIALFRHAGLRFAIIHGGLSDISRFIWSVSPDEDFMQEITAIEDAVGPIDAIVAGHSGIAFERKIGRHLWINAGVIGMPANDGRADTEFTLLENGCLTWHRLEYNHAAASSEMLRAGLVGGYAQTLVNGFWPSQDILPDTLRHAA